MTYSREKLIAQLDRHAQDFRKIAARIVNIEGGRMSVLELEHARMGAQIGMEVKNGRMRVTSVKFNRMGQSTVTPLTKYHLIAPIAKEVL